MNKTQVVNEVIRVYDENEQLKRELTELKEGKVPLSVSSSRNPTMDQEIIDLGRKDIFKKIMPYLSNDYYYAYKIPSVEVKDDDGKMNFITFEQWNKALGINLVDDEYKYLLNTMTFVAIKDYFQKELMQAFSDLVNKKKGEILSNLKEGKQ